MKVFAVGMVKDEIDIVHYTISNLLGQGVDKVIVADNMSTDGTKRILRTFEDLGQPVEVIEDNEVGYYQSAKMSELVQRAGEQGADYVIPFDADECWHVGPGATLADRLATCTAPVLACGLYNYFPYADDVLQNNPFLRITRRDCNASPLHKVIVQPVPGLVVLQGNHGATVPEHDFDPIRTDIQVGHFPWRTFNQFRSKVANGAAAYAATDLPEDQGAHWRSYGRILDERGEDGLREVYETWFENPELTTMVDPVAYRG